MRRYVFIEGSDLATSWWPHLKKSRMLNGLGEVYVLESEDLQFLRALKQREECLFFINGHGSSCALNSLYFRSTNDLLFTLHKLFPASKSYIHLGSCSSVSPRCFSLSRSLKALPNIYAVSGYALDVEADVAMELEIRLIKALSKTQLSFPSLKDLKSRIFCYERSLIRQSGFKFYLN